MNDSASNVINLPTAVGAERVKPNCVIEGCTKKRSIRQMCFRHANQHGIKPDKSYLVSRETCTVCKNPNKPKTDEFFSRKGANRTGPNSGFHAVCKDCRNKKAKTDKGRELRRKDGLRYKFGITQEFYFQLLSEQEGRCAICRTSDPGGRGKEWGTWCVDHDHVTEKVRGLLCSNCNLGIGNLHDSSATALSAALYLEKHGR